MDWLFQSHTFGKDISVLTFLIRVVASMIVGVLIGIDREKRSRPAGMRTQALVCMGATLVSIMEQQMVADVVEIAHSDRKSVV